MADFKADMIQLHVYREREAVYREREAVYREREAERDRPGKEKHNPGVEYLLLKRADEDVLYPGLWQMVTGMIEQGESAAEAARRELAEETGIAADNLIVVPCVPSFYSPTDEVVHHIPVFAMRTNHSTEVTLSREHQDFRWLDFEAAMQLLSFPGHKDGLLTLRDFIIEGDAPVTKVDFERS